MAHLIAAWNGLYEKHRSKRTFAYRRIVLHVKVMDLGRRAVSIISVRYQSAIINISTY